MKSLNTQEAKEYAFEKLNTLSDKSQRDFLLVHSEKVGLMADLVASKLGLDNDVFKIAGWLHDIGYTINMENHAEHTLTILEDEQIEVTELMRDCIFYHGVSSGKPNTKEGMIFQLADKLSVFDLETVDVFLSHGGLPLPDDHMKLLKMLSERAVVLLEGFEIK